CRVVRFLQVPATSAAGGAVRAAETCAQDTVEAPARAKAAASEATLSFIRKMLRRHRPESRSIPQPDALEIRRPDTRLVIVANAIRERRLKPPPRASLSGWA